MTLSALCYAFAFLAFLLLLLIFVRRGRGWAALLRPPSSKTRRLRLVESLAIDPKRRVTLIDFDGRELVILTGGATDLLLSSSTATGFDAALAEHTP